MRRHILATVSAFGLLILLLAAGEPVLAQEPASPAPAVNQVIIVFKTHFDIGYTDLAVNIVQKYRTTMTGGAVSGATARA
jgi:hypothetical protein